LPIELSGFDELQKQLKDLSKKAEQLDGENQVPVSELFGAEFMRKYTHHASFEELIETGGFVVNSPEDFLAIPDADWDAHILAATEFANWQEMLNQAGTDWAAKQLGF